MPYTVDVARFLDQRRNDLIASAEAGVGRAHLAHYEAAGTDVARDRLGSLFDVVIDSCRSHHIERALESRTAWPTTVMPVGTRSSKCRP